MIAIVQSSLLDAKEQFIAHQCNCITQNSAGTAKDIYDRFPYADIYAQRDKPSTPGTIHVAGDGHEQRYVINIFAQYYPGKPKYPDSSLDGVKARQAYFHKCLLQIAKLPSLKSIAFPMGIGCNLAGGDWNWYYGMLKIFEKYVAEKFSTKVMLYQHKSKFAIDEIK